MVDLSKHTKNARNGSRGTIAGKRLQLRRINGSLLEGDPAQLLSCEGPANHHRPGAARTFPTRWWPSISSRDGWGVLLRGHGQQLPAKWQHVRSAAVGEESEEANPHEAVRQHVQEEAQ